MAIFKQGQLNQLLAVCVDKTDFASVESGVTSGFTCTLYTYKQNSSAATSAVTLSAAPSVVRSGIIRVKIKTTESSGVDNALLKIAHASCADQYIPINFQIQDISDAISDAQSDIKSYLAGIGDTLSAVYVDTADISNVLSNLHADVADLSTVLSDFYSDFGSRVPKAVATNSQLSDLASDLRSYLVGISGAVSDAHSAATAANTNATAASSRALLNQSSVSDIYSLLAVVGSNVSNIESQIDAGVPIATGGIAATAFAAGAVDAAAVAQDAGQEIADEVLNRNLAGGGSGNTRNVRNALRTLRNKTIMNADSTVDVMAEDDATVAWSAVYSTAAGNPLVKVDP